MTKFQTFWSFEHLNFDIVSDPRFHGDEFTPAKAGVLWISYLLFNSYATDKE